jgi:hypothetical protein
VVTDSSQPSVPPPNIDDHANAATIEGRIDVGDAERFPVAGLSLADQSDAAAAGGSP